MGYTTEFEGSVSIEPPLNASEISYLRSFAESRRMNRTQGPLYVEGSGFRGQNSSDDGVIDGNRPHPDQPGLWCQWVPTDDGADLEWDGGEKFYESPQWMKYIVQKLLAPEGKGYVAAHIDEDPRLAHFTNDHVVNGEIFAQGEENEDRWWLQVTDNEVFVTEAVLTRGLPTSI